MRATPKQVRYALFLLAKAGYSVSWMNSTFSVLGASMRERSGRVENWLTNMNVAEISKVIDKLLKETKESE